MVSYASRKIGDMLGNRMLHIERYSQVRLSSRCPPGSGRGLVGMWPSSESKHLSLAD